MATVAPTVVNVTTLSVSISSGGSAVSVSVTLAASIVNVHVSAVEKFTSGSITNVVVPLPATAVWAPLLVQVMSNQAPSTFTGSLKVTVRDASSATFDAPWAGSVD